MTRDQFHNAIRVLLNMEAHELRAVGLASHQIQQFNSNPLVFFIKCDDPTCEAIWSIAEGRINRRAA